MSPATGGRTRWLRGRVSSAREPMNGMAQIRSSGSLGLEGFNWGSSWGSEETVLPVASKPVDRLDVHWPVQALPQEAILAICRLAVRIPAESSRRLQCPAANVRISCVWQSPGTEDTNVVVGQLWTLA
eukprot:12733111-Alexandrium_andersonii.AAC.1